MKGVFNFLKELSKHNNREWFADNKKAYENARDEFELFIADVIAQPGKWDKDILTLNPKDCIYRIYRDVRFSKDKTPYKLNFSGLISKDGRKAQGAINYIQVQPSQSFSAGGIYMPESSQLKAIRQEIDYNLADFEKVLNQKDFKENFGSLSEEWKLKTSPKDYSEDNPAIEYLRLKSFVAIKNYTDKEVLDKDFYKEVANSFKILTPLNAFLNRAISGE